MNLCMSQCSSQVNQTQHTVSVSKPRPGSLAGTAHHTYTETRVTSSVKNPCALPKPQRRSSANGFWCMWAVSSFHDPIRGIAPDALVGTSNGTSMQAWIPSFLRAGTLYHGGNGKNQETIRALRMGASETHEYRKRTEEPKRPPMIIMFTQIFGDS